MHTPDTELQLASSRLPKAGMQLALPLATGPSSGRRSISAQPTSTGTPPLAAEQLAGDNLPSTCFQGNPQTFSGSDDLSENSREQRRDEVEEDESNTTHSRVFYTICFTGGNIRVFSDHVRKVFYSVLDAFVCVGGGDHTWARQHMSKFMDNPKGDYAVGRPLRCLLCKVRHGMDELLFAPAEVLLVIVDKYWALARHETKTKLGESKEEFVENLTALIPTVRPR